MTLILRPLTAPTLVDLGRAGIVRAALVVQEIGAWGKGPWKVEYLTPTEDNGDGAVAGGRNGGPGSRRAVAGDSLPDAGQPGR